ncbi:MAG: ROK family protein [Phascolarctobacterium sp.]|nr:ROK family protein [Phascolarctobacterium sp.]
MLDTQKIMCLDIGGTMLKYGLASTDGNLSEVKSVPNKITKEGVESFVEQVMEIFDDYCLRGEHLLGLAIGTAGIVEEHTGKILLIGEHFKGYCGYPLGESLRALTGLPVIVANDVNAAALGEYFLGAGKGSRLMMMMTLGTGVGSAIIFDGKLIVGRHGATGEVGYYKLSDGSKLDEIGSTRGLVNCLASLTGENRDSLNGKIIIDRVKMGDVQAITALEKTMNYLAEGMVNISKTVDPDCIVLGGGIMEASAIVLPYLKQALLKQDTAAMFTDIDLRPAVLGNKAGMYGAVRYFLEATK